MRNITRACILVVSILLIGKAIAERPYPVTYTEDKLAVTVTPMQPVFIIKLKSNPTTGFMWYLRSYDVNVLSPIKHVFLAPENKKLIGAPGYEVWTFRVKPAGVSVPMQTQVKFVYGRAWESDSKAQQVIFQVSTQPNN